MVRKARASGPRIPGGRKEEGALSGSNGSPPLERPEGACQPGPVPQPTDGSTPRRRTALRSTCPAPSCSNKRHAPYTKEHVAYSGMTSAPSQAWTPPAQRQSHPGWPTGAIPLLLPETGREMARTCEFVKHVPALRKGIASILGQSIALSVVHRPSSSLHRFLALRAAAGVTCDFPAMSSARYL